LTKEELAEAAKLQEEAGGGEEAYEEEGGLADQDGSTESGRSEARRGNAGPVSQRSNEQQGPSVSDPLFGALGSNRCYRSYARSDGVRWWAEGLSLILALWYAGGQEAEDNFMSVYCVANHVA
jgi:hypothetical protein